MKRVLLPSDTARRGHHRQRTERRGERKKKEKERGKRKEEGQRLSFSHGVLDEKFLAAGGKGRGGKKGKRKEGDFEREIGLPYSICVWRSTLCRKKEKEGRGFLTGGAGVLA